MTQTPPLHCGHCGAALAPGVAFCGRCGRAVPRAAAVPAGPVPAGASPAGAVPAPAPPPPPPPFARAAGTPRTKLRHGQTLLIAGGAIAALVVVLTIIAVKVAGSGAHCGFFCGPHQGPRLSDEKSFTDTKWGFVIDYGGATLTLNKSDPQGDTADFLATDAAGDPTGEITVTAMSQTSTQAAIQKELDAYSGGQFSSPQPVEAIPGAEIALIPGDGEGYTSKLASSDGSTGTPVGIQIIAIQHGNETLVASMWSPIQQDVSFAPFYLFSGETFDHVLTELHFTGG